MNGVAQSEIELCEFWNVLRNRQKDRFHCHSGKEVPEFSLEVSRIKSIVHRRSYIAILPVRTSDVFMRIGMVLRYGVF